MLSKKWALYIFDMISRILSWLLMWGKLLLLILRRIWSWISESHIFSQKLKSTLPLFKNIYVLSAKNPASCIFYFSFVPRNYIAWVLASSTKWLLVHIFLPQMFPGKLNMILHLVMIKSNTFLQRDSGNIYSG